MTYKEDIVMIDCTTFPDNSIVLYKAGVQLPATHDPSIDAPIYTITQNDTIDVYIRSVMYPEKKYYLSISAMGIPAVPIIQEGFLDSDGCGVVTVTINDTGVYTPSHAINFGIETQPGTPGGEGAHAFITVIPCPQPWQCEHPLNGYESDGECGHRRLNPICNQPNLKIDCTLLPDNSIVLYKAGVQLPATYDPSIDAPIYTINQGDTIDVYFRSVMYPEKKYGLNISAMGTGGQKCSSNVIDKCGYVQEGSLNSDGCGTATVTINDTGVYTPSHIIGFGIYTQPGTPGGEGAHAFIKVNPPVCDTLIRRLTYFKDGIQILSEPYYGYEYGSITLTQGVEYDIYLSVEEVVGESGCLTCDVKIVYSDMTAGGIKAYETNFIRAKRSSGSSRLCANIKAIFDRPGIYMGGLITSMVSYGQSQAVIVTPNPDCLPHWHCDALNPRYESDGCGNRRWSISCNLDQILLFGGIVGGILYYMCTSGALKSGKCF